MVKRVICKEHEVPEKTNEMIGKLLEIVFKSKGLLHLLDTRTNRFPRVKQEQLGNKKMYYGDNFTKDGVFVCSIEVKYDYMPTSDAYKVTVICEDKKG